MANFWKKTKNNGMLIRYPRVGNAFVPNGDKPFLVSMMINTSQCDLLSQQKIITCHVGDKNLIEFEKLISKQANVVMFDNYDSCTQRLDSFFLTS